MRRSHRRFGARVAFGACLALLLVSLSRTSSTLSAHAESSPASSARRAVVLPRIPIRERILENGLTVYAVENHALPKVSLFLAYRVGGSDDPERRSGLAHLIQHLMFMQTSYLSRSEYELLLSEMGGESDARTNYDSTVFETSAFSGGLERLLWIEAERMARLQITDTNLRDARTEVRAQWNDGVLGTPYGYLDLVVGQQSYSRAYRRPVIGIPAELDMVTPDEARAFYQQFYRPDNAILVVVGDFTQSELDTWIDRYFAPIARPKSLPTRARSPEPARTSPRQYVHTRRGVPLPALAVTYPLPGTSAVSDSPALEILQAYLTDGEASRLYRNLVAEQRVAATAMAYADQHLDAGLFVVRLTVAGGRRIELAERALLSELKQLSEVPLPPEELARARQRALASVLEMRQTNAGLATVIGESALHYNDVERINGETDRIASVSAEELRRVAANLFKPENRLVIRYLSEGSTQAKTVSNESGTLGSPSSLMTVPRSTPTTSAKNSVTTPRKPKPKTTSSSKRRRRTPRRQSQPTSTRTATPAATAKPKSTAPGGAR